MNEKTLKIAKECGFSIGKWKGNDCITIERGTTGIMCHEELERFAIRMKQEALLEAAGENEEYKPFTTDFEQGCTQGWNDKCDEIRRMAEQLGKGGVND